MRDWLLVLTTLLIALAGCQGGEPSDDDSGAGIADDDAADDDAAEPDDLSAMLQAHLADTEIPAMGAAVVQGDGMLALGAAGVRKQGDDTPVDPDDPFHLGSCTKAMTATLLGTLVVDGTLSWDTSLDEAFPDMTGMHTDYEGVTLAQLLSHWGGVPANILEYPAIWNPLWTSTDPLPEQRLWFAEQVLTMEPESTPGTAYAYSNAGYMIVGSAVEQATGKAWEELLDERLFQPLQMSGCGFGAPGTAGEVDAPWGHQLTDDGAVAEDPGSLYSDNPAALGPAGTVHCPLPDWARFASAHMAGANGEEGYLPSEVWERLHTPWPGGEYALGWGVGERDWANGTILNHNGSNTMWYATAWLGLPTQQAYLTVTNIGGQAAAFKLDSVTSDLIAEYATRTTP